jgi:hypothetical protein
MSRSFFIATLPICVSIILGGTWLASAGDINPPAGAVGDTFPTLGFKTLQQVEPRTPLNRAGGGIGENLVISVPGSYYLTGNYTAPGNNQPALRIAAFEGSVDIDLNGFRLATATGGALTADAIQIDGPATNPYKRHVRIRNGHLTAAGAGIEAISAGGFRTRITVEDVRVGDTGQGGIIGGEASRILDCTVDTVLGNGITVGQGSVVDGCVVHDASGHGISADTGSVIDRCTTYSCTGSGISGSTGCVIEGCIAYSCGSSGIAATTGSLVRGCLARANGGVGIGGTDLLVTDCLVRENPAGITISNTGLVIGCSAINNTSNGITMTVGAVHDSVAHATSGTFTGISGSLVTRCRATGYATDIRVAIGQAIDNVCGTLTAENGTALVRGNDVFTLNANNLPTGERVIIVGNAFTTLNSTGSNGVGSLISATGTITSTNPWANFDR